jgi:hypothetical protein
MKDHPTLGLLGIGARISLADPKKSEKRLICASLKPAPALSCALTGSVGSAIVIGVMTKSPGRGRRGTK